MAEKLEKKLAGLAEKTLRPGEHVLAAVSGGADSVALLRLLCALRDKGTIRLSAAHFEHGIRGGESLGDMRFVRRLCAQLHISLYEGSGDVPAQARLRRMGLEETAREMRIAFLRQAKKDAGAQVIALAHHADDQAETVLMHILRGSGGKGACGMRERAGEWVRPLLHCRKAELIDYLAQGGFSWREDSTNAEPFTPRNALRLQVLPEMEKIFPGAVQALARFARIQQIENDFLEGEAVRWLESSVRTGPYGARAALSQLPDRAVLARAMKLLAGREALSTDVERLCGLCFGSGGKLDLRGRYPSAQAAAGELWLFSQPPPETEQPVRQQGETNFAPWGILRAEKGAGVPLRDDPYRQELDAQALRGAHIRLWRAGDRIRPLGMGGKSRLLSDIWAAGGVPPQRRRFMPVLEKDGEVLWAVGACISETAKLKKESIALRLEWTPAEEPLWKNTTDDGGISDAQ